MAALTLKQMREDPRVYEIYKEYRSTEEYDEEDSGYFYTINLEDGYIFGSEGTSIESVRTVAEIRELVQSIKEER